jgi:predicted DNA-binding protein
MSWNTKTSKSYPIRLKNKTRHKLEIVAANKGRKISEHLHWLINQSITNYEMEFGEINVPKEEE